MAQLVKGRRRDKDGNRIRPAADDLKRTLHLDLQHNADALRQRVVQGFFRRAVIISGVAGMLQELAVGDHFFKARLIHKEIVDAVLIAPNFREETMSLTSYLEGKKIPYAFVDFNIEDTHALCYIGQDSQTSGYMAAKILMRKYKEGQELILFLNNKKNSPAEIQMQRRMDGFMNFIAQEHENLVVHDVVLNKEDDEANRRTLEDFFAAHPKAVLGAVFNSRVYQVAGYLQETGHHLEGLVGYDLLPKNVEYLKSGEVNYLIGQRPGLQGYCGVKALCDHVVFKRPVTGVKYMPIDILMKENINFYFEFE